MNTRVVICGRPNVGKSTIFNQLTTGKSLVHNRPGITRDWLVAKIKGTNIDLIDTAGLHELDDEVLASEASNRTIEQFKDASLIFLVVDAKAGITPHDSYFANLLRKKKLPIPIVTLVNKCENKASGIAAAEFYQLGFKPVLEISASHRHGLDELVEFIIDNTNKAKDVAKINDEANDEDTINIAILGRPNVGKSTLTNAILGMDRMMVSNIPGTTIDAVPNTFTYKEHKIKLIDTAGVRKKGKIADSVEFASTKVARRIAEQADIIILMIDIFEGVVHQDQLLANLIAQYGRATVVILNKEDLIDPSLKRKIKAKAKKELQFMDYASLILTSVNDENFNAQRIIDEALEVYAQANIKIPPRKISAVLHSAITANSPPRDKNRQAKLRFAQQVSTNPPLIIIHGRNVDIVKQTYVRYLSHKFADELGYRGAPIHIQLKEAVDRRLVSQ